MRTSCLVLSLSMPLVHAAAQEGFQFGAKVIPTWSWFMNEDDEGIATSGLCYGAGVNYHWADGIGAGIDLIWGTETQEYNDGANDWTLERSFSNCLCFFISIRRRRMWCRSWGASASNMWLCARSPSPDRAASTRRM